MWDGAAAAARYMEAAAAEILGSGVRSVLELGSGTGLAGLAAAAALHLPTLLTDLPEVLPSLRHNIAANPGLAGLASAAPLDWRAPRLPPAADRAAAAPGGGSAGRLVLAADCVWLEELVQPFVAALELAAAGPADRALLAYQSRSSRVDGLLLGQLRQRFEVEAVPPRPGEPPRGPIDIYWMTPRASAAPV